MAFPGGQWFSDWVAGVPADEARRRYMLGTPPPLKPRIRLIDRDAVARQTGLQCTREALGWCVWRCAVPHFGAAGVGSTPAKAYESWRRAVDARYDADAAAAQR